MTDNVIAELVFRELKNQLENQSCFDCGELDPKWVSLSNGVFICMQCSSIHRTIGAQYSIVQSIGLDSWSEKQLKMMTIGGNKKLFEYFNDYQLNTESMPMRYKSKAAEFYRRRLKFHSEGLQFEDSQPSYDEGREQAPEQSQQDQELSPNYTFYNRSDFEDDKQPGFFDRPLLESLWRTGVAVKNKSERVIAQAGQKLDDTGYPQKASYYVQYAVDGSLNVGGKVVNAGSEKLHQIQQIPRVHEFTEKSKSAMDKIGTSVTGASSSVMNKVKTYISADEKQDDNWQQLQYKPPKIREPRSNMIDKKDESNGGDEEKQDLSNPYLKDINK